MSNEGFEGLSIAFYLILLSSIAIGVMTFLYDEKNALALINLSVKVNKPAINNQMNYNNGMMNQPQQMMNNQMQQVNNQSMMNNQMNHSNGMMNQPVITGYDPMTGAPIYSNNN